MKLSPMGCLGWRLRWRGVDVVARVRTPRVASLAGLMRVRPPANVSRSLLCPMPGVITSLLVKAGDTVESRTGGRHRRGDEDGERVAGQNAVAS